MSLRSNNGFGTSLSSTPKRHGNGCLNTLRLVAFWRWECFKDSTRRGEQGVSCVGGIIYILSGIGKYKVGRWFSPRVGVRARGLEVVLGKWSWGGGGILGLVGSVGCPRWCLVVWFSLHGGVSRPRGPPPLGEGTFSSFWSYFILALVVLALCLKNKLG